MKKVAFTLAGTVGFLLAGMTAQAGIITSTDGIAFEGGAIAGEQEVIGWTILAANEVSVRSVSSTTTFASDAQSTFELGTFSSPNTRIGRDFLRNGVTSLDTNGGELDASYSWFKDGDTLDLSGAGDSSLSFTSGLTVGSNWAFISFDNAPTNYTGYTAELGGVSQVAFELIWDDVDESGTRSIGDTYDFGTILYATDGDTFNGGNWSNGSPTIVPESGTYALLSGLTGLFFVALRRRR